MYLTVRLRAVAALVILSPFYILALIGAGWMWLFNTGPLARAVIRFSDRVAGV